MEKTRHAFLVTKEQSRNVSQSRGGPQKDGLTGGGSCCGKPLSGPSRAAARDPLPAASPRGIAGGSARLAGGRRLGNSKSRSPGERRNAVGSGPATKSV